MAKSKPSKPWAEQLADLEDPAPKDFDPEDIPQENSGDDDASSTRDEDLAVVREHYVEVGKSKLRKLDGIVVGPQYEGSRISREALLQDGSDDDPFAGHSEQEESGNSEYADPEEDFQQQAPNGHEEIDIDQAFESGDEGVFRSYTSSGSKNKSEDQDASQSRAYADPEEDLEQQGDDEDDEIKNDEEFESGDDKKFGDSTFRGSKRAREDQDEELEDQESGDGEDEEPDQGMDASADDFNGVGSDPYQQEDGALNIEMSESEHSGESDSDNTSMSDGSDEPNANDRAALRKMMAEEQKMVAASLSKTAKADIAKGRAIKQKRSTFDSLLNTRIKLQKALIASNSMSASPSTSTDHTEAIFAAESAAFNLWDTISSLRSSLHSSNPKNPPLSATQTTPSTTLWTHMQALETASFPTRRTTLSKWSQKTYPITTLPRTHRFFQTPSQQALTSVLDQHLTGSSAQKLLDRTRIPRSCAPIQAASRVVSDAAIYDDADFYTLLLRELVNQHMADSNAPTSGAVANGAVALPSRRDFKVKKVVDTKASKGRKMRYAVHERLQNFMAPDDRGNWGERQRTELFSSLLGRKIVLGEGEEVEDGSVDGNMDVDMEQEQGFKVFG